MRAPLLLWANTPTHVGLHKCSVSSSCIHNTVFCLFYSLHPLHTHTYTGYMSQAVCSLACYGWLPCSHYLPASLPPLFLSDTEKLTLPPPSLLTCFCPLSPIADKHHTLYIPPCRVSPLHPYLHAPVKIPSPTYCCISIIASHQFYLAAVCSPSSLSLNQCRCCSAASTENWFCLQIHCISLLSIHCSLHHSPSLFFSASLAGNPHFIRAAFPPPQIHLCALLTLLFSVHVHRGISVLS